MRRIKLHLTQPEYYSTTYHTFCTPLLLCLLGETLVTTSMHLQPPRLSLMQCTMHFDLTHGCAGDIVTKYPVHRQESFRIISTAFTLKTTLDDLTQVGGYCVSLPSYLGSLIASIQSSCVSSSASWCTLCITASSTQVRCYPLAVCVHIAHSRVHVQCLTSCAVMLEGWTTHCFAYLSRRCWSPSVRVMNLLGHQWCVETVVCVADPPFSSSFAHVLLGIIALPESQIALKVIVIARRLTYH